MINHLKIKVGMPAVLTALLLTAQTSTAAYLLHPGDMLTVSVLGHGDLERRVVIDMDGRIFLPLLGELSAGGKTLLALREEIVSGYSATIYRGGAADDIQTISPNAVLVEINEYRPVHVLGDVSRPGELAFRPGDSVLKAVAGAGGFGHTVGSSEGNEIAALRLGAQADTLRRRIDLDRDAIGRLRDDVRNMLPRAASTAPAAGEVETNAEGAPDASESWTFARKKARELRDEQTAATIRRLRNRLEILEAQEAGAAQIVELDEGRVESLEETAQLRFVDEQTLMQARQALVMSTSRALEISAARGDIEVELSRLALSDEISDQIEIANAMDQIRSMEDALQISLMELQGILVQIRQLGISSPELIAEPAFIIYRDSPDGLKRLEAEPQTMLEPGDVIDVRLKYRDMAEDGPDFE
jgi:polysaccharide export outer membrane protein